MESGEREGDMESVGKGREIWRVWGEGGRYGECGERKGDMECEEGRKIWTVWGKGERYGVCGEREGDMESGEREGDMECEEGRKIWTVWGKGGRYGECGEREGDMECEERREIWGREGDMECGEREGDTESWAGGGGGREKDRGMRGGEGSEQYIIGPPEMNTGGFHPQSSFLQHCHNHRSS